MTEKEKIINYTTVQFFKTGFKKLTMDQLAYGMKISKKTIYKYFPSKISLINEVIFSFQDKVKTSLDEIVKSSETTIVKLKKVAKFFVDFFQSIDENLLTDFLRHNPELWLTVDNFRKNVIESVWRELIIQGQDEGKIIKGNITIIVRSILSALRGVIDPKFLTENKISTNEAFEIVFLIIIGGILTEKGKEDFENE